MNDKELFFDHFITALHNNCLIEYNAEQARSLGNEAAQRGLTQADLAAAYEHALAVLFSQPPPDAACVAHRAALFFMEVWSVLDESAERYRQMFQKNQAVKLLIDPTDGAIVDANPAACQFYDYTLDVLKTLKISDINTLPPDQIEAELARAGQEQRVYFRFQHRLASGEIRDVEVYSGPITLDGRQLLFSIIHDITERKLAEKRLQQSLENYQALVSSIQGIVWESDAATFQFTFVSQNAESLLGYPVEAWIGSPTFWVEHLHPDDQKWAPSFCVSETTLKRNHVFEYRMVAADGRIVWLQDIVSVIVEDDEPIKLRGVMIDITERKWIEAELARSHEEVQHQVEKALRESETRYRMLFDSSNDAIFVHEPYGLFLDVNRTAYDRLGYTRDELLKLTPTDIDTPEYKAKTKQRIADLVQRGRGFFETAHIRRDGTIVPVEISAQITDYDGRKVILSTARDITERKQAEAELQARAIRQAALAELSQMALSNGNLDGLMQRAIHLITQTLRLDYAAIWELAPDVERLYLRVGSGWPDYLIETAPLNTDKSSHEGQTLFHYEPVIVPCMDQQIDCPNTTFIREYGIESSVCIAIHGTDHPFGILCGYNTHPRRFTTDEVNFLQVLADVLAQAAERQRADAAERELRTLAEALREIAAALNSTLNLEKVLELILANIGRVVPHHAAHIMLIEQDQAVVMRQYGYAAFGLENQLVSQHFNVSEHPHLSQMSTTGQPMVISDKSAYPSWWNDLSGPSLPSYVGAPIRREGETIGFLQLDSATPDFFKVVHAERLKAFADQAAVAIHNARLYEQSRHLATLEERQRLARDLHDAVSQTLFSASVVAEALPRLWERDMEAVRQGLDELHLLTRGALAEMRTLLLELRPMALIEARFDDLLRHLTQAFSGKHRITVELGIIGDIPPLPPNVQVALYRIVQEALNNIAKHARASHVIITLSKPSDCITLRVKDNGRGFDQSLRYTNRFGLQIMHERARGIGADFTISSEPGYGTEILVQWAEDRLSGDHSG